MTTAELRRESTSPCSTAWWMRSRSALLFSPRSRADLDEHELEILEERAHLRVVRRG